MNEAAMNTKPEHDSVPPPIPQDGTTSPDQTSKINHLIVTYFWWIIAGAALVKVIAYFIAPAGNATAGYHFGRLLVGFISYGGILVLVAFVLAQIVRSRAHVFKIAFAVLFSLACLLNLPTAVLRYQTYAAGTKLLESYAAFEALMQYEDNPVEGENETGGDFFGREATVTKYRKSVVHDAQKYFNTAYCYATGFDYRQKDIPKVVQLCQRAASQDLGFSSQPGYYAGKQAKERAQAILTKAGLSWAKPK